MKNYLYITICICLNSVLGLGQNSGRSVQFTERKSDYKSTEKALIQDINGGYIWSQEKNAISNWWGGSKIHVSNESGEMVLRVNGAGSEYDRFGCNLSPVANFSENHVLKVTVKAVADMAPSLRIDMKDINNHVTNGSDIKVRIIPNQDYITYYYNYEGRFYQGWPTRAGVDPSSIVQLEFFINPGESNFSGKIHIKEIKAISKDQMDSELKNGSNKKPIDKSFPINDPSLYAWSNSDQYDLDKNNERLQIKAYGTGTNWQSFGIGVPVSNLGPAPVVRIKARALQNPTELRVDLVDIFGNKTNGEAIQITIPSSEEFKDYYYDFQNKLYQGWPSSAPVNAQFINELMIFANPGGPDYTGTIEITEVEFITDYQFHLQSGLRHYKAKGDKFTVYAPDFDNTWWSTEEKTPQSTTTGVRVEAKGETTFGTGIDPVDVTTFKTLLLDLNIETEDNLNVQIMDNNGETSDWTTLQKSATPNIYTLNIHDLATTNKSLNPHIITGITFKTTNSTANSIMVSTMIMK